MKQTSEILKITNFCTSKCKHCPYRETGEHYDLKTIEAEIKKISNPIVLISGGEPFSHPDIKKIIHLFSKEKKIIFRIATGGHIPILEYLEPLSRTKNFSGISVSVDNFFQQRIENKENQSILLTNLKNISENKISFSITITLGNDIQIQDVKMCISALIKYSPRFFLIQNTEKNGLTSDLFNNVAISLRNNFPQVEFLFENYY